MTAHHGVEGDPPLALARNDVPHDAIAAMDLRDVVPAIRVPTTVILGRHDPQPQAFAEALAQ